MDDLTYEQVNTILKTLGRDDWTITYTSSYDKKFDSEEYDNAICSEPTEWINNNHEKFLSILRNKYTGDADKDELYDMSHYNKIITISPNLVNVRLLLENNVSLSFEFKFDEFEMLELLQCGFKLYPFVNTICSNDFINEKEVIAYQKAIIDKRKKYVEEHN